MNLVETHLKQYANGEWFLRLNQHQTGILIPQDFALKISDAFIKEDARAMDEDIDKQLRCINCHKIILYLLEKIPKEEMNVDPKIQKIENPNIDFTYGKKALEISNKEFVLVKDENDLKKLANEVCGERSLGIGQILDIHDGSLAHSFLVGKDSSDNFVCFEKTGFKHYPFSVHLVESLLDFINEKGERSYWGQKWRFVPISEIK